MTGHHKLVPANIVDTSTARQSRDGSVSDFGWDKGAQYNVRPWIKGLDNEVAWVLVRRMNHGIFDLRRTKHVPPGGLDLIQAKNAKFSPNKLRSEVERLYMGMMLGLFSFMKSMARLRSWREPRRTSAFCIAYFAAWYLDCLFALFLCTNIALVISPQVRLALFPPAPLSMVNISDGSIAKPMGGTLGSTDTATGAPQNLKGESAENEASNFITSVAAIATNLLSGQDPYGAPTEMDAGNKGYFTPQLDVSTMAVAKDKASGMDRPSEDKTKAPMEETVWKQMTPLLHGIILLADTWERLSNILLPTPPFDRENHQFRLALYIAPLAVASLILTRDVAVKSLTFLLGFALFGDPLITRGYHYARRNGWTESFHPSNTLFRGAPTNLQIALTLLRLGEANQAPLPPPARVHHAPPDKAIDIDEHVIDASLGDQPLGVSQHHLEDIAEHNQDMADHAGGDDSEVIQATGHGAKREKVFGLFKDGARGAVKAIAAADKVRAKFGVENSKLRAGVVPSSRDATEIVGPVQFSARYEGQTGFIHINSGAEEPWVAFNRNAVDEHGDLRTVWKIKIDDIVQLRKHAGHGMLAKLATGWATDGPIYDSVRIIDAQKNEWVVTALPYRDALFNRLCAIGKRAKWEIW